MPQSPVPNPQSPIDNLAASIVKTGAATVRAHQTFLDFSQQALHATAQTLARQARLFDSLNLYLRAQTKELHPACAPADVRPADARGSSYGKTERRAAGAPARPVAFSRAMCLEFATGRVANVLGPDFAEVDTYRARVRLPDEPLMLVDRILAITGEPRSLTRGTITTEHDVLRGAWYLDGGRAPVCIAIEAGQADLFLCSHLGIDLIVKGTRTYRLLDATVRFHRGLPTPGETIRYDIAIDNFVRQGDTYLFFFRFEGTINGRPLLTMTNGCAGFFTEEEIENSGGIVLTPEQPRPQPGRRPADGCDLVPLAVESYNEQQLDALRAGDLAGCFGPLFANLNLSDPPRIPTGRMRLVHRVAEIDPAGGRYGLGMIRAEADIHPDDWFLTCHFLDDMVMPGTLMYECCAHTLRILLLRMGWVGEQSSVCYEPVPGVPAVLKCRGPVTPKTKVATYEVQLKELGYRPEPYVIADALMYADGRRIVQFTDMSMQLTGLTREQIEATWRQSASSPLKNGTTGPGGPASPQPGGASLPRCLVASRRVPLVACPPVPSKTEPIGSRLVPTDRAPAIFDTDRILAFATGSPVAAFGDRYAPFERDRFIARLPAPPFSFLTRITQIHARPWQFQPGGWVEAQYDLPPNAWYLRANRQASMPYCVLQEFGLQACGWLAAYVGSALRSEQDLRFRNLGGTAALHAEVFPDAGTLTARARLTKATQAGDTLLLEYDLEVWNAGRLVYDANSSFGFFTEPALAQQTGIRDAELRQFTPTGDEILRADSFVLDKVPPLTPDDTNTCVVPSAGCPTPHRRTAGSPIGMGDGPSTLRACPPVALPARALLMIDKIDLLILDGGPHGLGFIRGVKHIDPGEWFFKAHFHQDPVWPGSLSLEAMLQVLKVYALRRWPELESTHRFEPVAVGAMHSWLYRGQITPATRRVLLDAVITRCEDGDRPLVAASGFLKADSVVVYEMNDFAIRLVPAE